jgi:hypothetical protein
MHRRMFAITVVLIAWSGSFSPSAHGQESKPPDLSWIVGSWRSHDLDYGDFGEWQGATKIELVATSPEAIDLYLVYADGRRTRAPDSEPCRLTDRTLFFGPIGSGLSFDYRRPNDDTLILDLKTNDEAIHAELRRERRK